MGADLVQVKYGNRKSKTDDLGGYGRKEDFSTV